MKYNGALKNRHLISNEMKGIQTQKWFTDPSLSSSRFFSHRPDCGCIDLCPLKNQGCILGGISYHYSLAPCVEETRVIGAVDCPPSALMTASLTAREGNFILIHCIMGEEDLCRLFSLKLPFRPSDQ